MTYHIAVDFREATRPTRAGKGEYVYQLVRAWLEQGFDAELILLIATGQTVELPFGRWREQSFAGGLLWHWRVARWLAHRPVDVYLASLSLIVPAISRAVPVVTTLFDFSAWRYPGTHLSRTVWLEKLFARTAVARSVHLLAISEFTKREAVALFGVRPDKITVTPMAAATQFRPLPPDESIRARYHLPDKFILYLGTIEPRKNLLTLIAAFNRIRSQLADVSLVLAGGEGWRANAILRLADARIIFPGYIEAADRPALYGMAEVFVFPSLYEGFGIPPLEAMACGVPTIVSDRASLPEVVGGAAVQVPAANPEALARALLETLNSPTRRAALRQQGLARARHFTWARTAQLTWEILKRYG